MRTTGTPNFTTSQEGAWSLTSLFLILRWLSSTKESSIIEVYIHCWARGHIFRMTKRSKKRVNKYALVAHDCSFQKAGITLVEVPYWWDKTKESLAATIQQHRTDLLL